MEFFPLQMLRVFMLVVHYLLKVWQKFKEKFADRSRQVKAVYCESDSKPVQQIGSMPDPREFDHRMGIPTFDDEGDRALVTQQLVDNGLSTSPYDSRTFEDNNRTDMVIGGRMRMESASVERGTSLSESYQALLKLLSRIGESRPSDLTDGVSRNAEAVGSHDFNEEIGHSIDDTHHPIWPSDVTDNVSSNVQVAERQDENGEIGHRTIDVPEHGEITGKGRRHLGISRPVIKRSENLEDKNTLEEPNSDERFENDVRASRSFAGSSVQKEVKNSLNPRAVLVDQDQNQRTLGTIPPKGWPQSPKPIAKRVSTQKNQPVERRDPVQAIDPPAVSKPTNCVTHGITDQKRPKDRGKYTCSCRGPFSSMGLGLDEASSLFNLDRIKDTDKAFVDAHTTDEVPDFDGCVDELIYIIGDQVYRRDLTIGAVGFDPNRPDNGFDRCVGCGITFQSEREWRDHSCRPSISKTF